MSHVPHDLSSDIDHKLCLLRNFCILSFQEASKINKNVIDFTKPPGSPPETFLAHVRKNPANPPFRGILKEIFLDIFSPSLVLYTL
jgi:hypothetical protein